MNNKLKSMCKERVVAQFECLPTICQERMWNTGKTSVGVVSPYTEIQNWYFPNQRRKGIS